MPHYPREIEIERLNNLARNFGWEKVKEEQIDDNVLITFKKKLAVKPELASEEEAG